MQKMPFLAVGFEHHGSFFRCLGALANFDISVPEFFFAMDHFLAERWNNLRRSIHNARMAEVSFLWRDLFSWAKLRSNEQRLNFKLLAVTERKPCIFENIV